MRAKTVNEVFDVLTWSKDHLTPEIYQNVRDSHKGKYGEKVQTSLLKCQDKDEILKWHNLKFEIGMMETIAFKRGSNPYRKLDIGKYRQGDLDKLDKNDFAIYFEALASAEERNSLYYKDEYTTVGNEYYNGVIEKVKELVSNDIFTNDDMADYNDESEQNSLQQDIEQTMKDNPKYQYAYDYHEDWDYYKIFYSKVRLPGLKLISISSPYTKFTHFRK